MFLPYFTFGVCSQNIYHILELNQWPYLDKLWLFKPYLISIYTIFKQLLKPWCVWP